MNEVPITIVGNVTGLPDLRFTQSGRAVANFSVATTPRVFDKESGRWQDGDTSFYRVTAWGDLGESVAEFVGKGKRVIVTGTIQMRTWDDNGTNRSTFEVTAQGVGLDLTFLKPIKEEEPTTAERPATAKKAVAKRNPMSRAKAAAQEAEEPAPEG